MRRRLNESFAVSADLSMENGANVLQDVVDEMFEQFHAGRKICVQGVQTRKTETEYLYIVRLMEDGKPLSNSKENRAIVLEMAKRLELTPATETRHNNIWSNDFHSGRTPVLITSIARLQRQRLRQMGMTLIQAVLLALGVGMFILAQSFNASFGI